MNEHEQEIAAALAVLGLSAIAALAISNYKKRQRIKKLRRLVKNVASALDLSEELFTIAVEQNPEMKVPQKWLDSLNALNILMYNDI